jgi:cyclophilin family peptidyl-prolyl cis-trans isomerase/predicted small secreted protein
MRRMRRPRSIAAVLVVAAPLLAACGSSGSGGTTADIPSGNGSPTVPAAPQPKAAATAAGCKKVAAPAPKPKGGAKKPAKPLDASKKWTLRFSTSCGAFTVSLDLKSAPHASASMVSLANGGFFKNTIFHRIVPSFVIQGGDPTGTGTGGPGYSTHDKPPSNARYTRGVVAMAKTPQEPRGTAGSQFYVVTGADAGLPPDYAIIGKVVKGLPVVLRIGKLGDANEQPTQTVELYGVKAAGS